MRIDDLKNGPVYVIGLHFVYPPSYLHAPGDGTWGWTHNPLDAFPFRSAREASVKLQDPAVARLVAGQPAKVLELTVQIRSV